MQAQPRVTASILQVLQPLDGGVAQHVLELALGLRGHGWDVEVAAPPRCVILPELEAAGVRVTRLELSRSPAPLDLPAARTLRRLDRMRRYAIVHAHSSKAGAIVRSVLPGRRRFVYTPHCFAFASEDFGMVARLAYRAVEQSLIPRTAGLVAVSEWEAEEGRRLVGARSRVQVIPNGTRPCRPAAPDPELAAWRGNGPLAALVSKLRPQKDPLALVRAAGALARRGELHGRVAVVGDGELEGAVRAEIETRGLGEWVRWFPFRRGVDSYLAAVDVLVAPSRWESLPIGVIEAMACGVPVLATAVGGVPELIEDGRTGRLVPPGNPEMLEKALAELLDDPEQRSRLGAAGRAAAGSRLSVDGMVEATAALYARLLERQARSARSMRWPRMRTTGRRPL